MASTPKVRDPFKDIVGTCAAQTAAMSLSILSPLILGAMIISFGVGEAEAGGLVTLELLVIGVTSMLLAPALTKLPLHSLAIVGSIIMLIFNVLSAEKTGFSELYGLRVAAGIGGGMVVATVNAAIARSRAPVLLYGVSWAVVYLFTAAVAIAMSQNELTYPSAIRWCALVLAVVLPMLWLLPRGKQERALTTLPAGTGVIGCGLLLGLALIGSSMMAYYAFVERLADAIGASASARGVIVAGVQIGGIIGGAIAAPVAARFGVVKALLVAVTLHAAMIIIAVSAADVLEMGIAAFCEAVLFILMIPLMLALAGELDREGRWAAAAGGTLVLSTAIGPLLGGMLIETVGYGALAWIQIGAVVPALAMLAWVGRSIFRLSLAKQA